jgi:hypothetical protein
MYIRILKLEETTEDSVFLWGARQTGKSTLLETLFPKARYYDLLKSEEFERLFRQPSLLREELQSVDAESVLVVITNHAQVLGIKRKFASEVEKAKGELRSEFNNATNAAKLEAFCEGMKGVALGVVDGKAFDTIFYLLTQGFVAAYQLCFNYAHRKYAEHVDFFLERLK